jgi:hypothetical protein
MEVAGRIGGEGSVRKALFFLGTMVVFGVPAARVFQSGEIDKSTTAVKYKSYKFFTVETQIEI